MQGQKKTLVIDPLAAARVPDLVLIPCRPQLLDIETIESTKTILAKKAQAVVILNSVPPVGFRRREEAVAAIGQFGLKVLEQSISQRADLATRSPTARQRWNSRGAEKHVENETRSQRVG